MGLQRLDSGYCFCLESNEMSNILLYNRTRLRRTRLGNRKKVRINRGTSYPYASSTSRNLWCVNESSTCT